MEKVPCKMRVALGVCTKCGLHKAINGKKKCVKCTERHALMQKKKYDDAIARGYCTRCLAHPAVKGKTKCSGCSSKGKKSYEEKRKPTVTPRVRKVVKQELQPQEVKDHPRKTLEEMAVCEHSSLTGVCKSVIFSRLRSGQLTLITIMRGLHGGESGVKKRFKKQ